MRFGIFYEHQMARPWAENAEETTLKNALEQVELADKLGIDYAWEVEHHFLEEYSHSSAPEVFLAAASQRTSRIRLGHGVVQLPTEVNHPARIAERLSTLDLISGGRVDFGTGEGSSQAELGGFGVQRDDKRAQWEESLDAVTRMMVEEPFAGYDGDFVSMPPRNVVPKPKQKPHPPLWVACSRRDTILTAARKGLGALSFSFVEPEAAKEWVDDYYKIIASPECVPGGFSVNPNVAVVLPFMCHTDEETAIERGIDGAHFFGYSLAHYYVFGTHRPAQTNVWEEFQTHRAEYGFAREIINAESGPLGVKILEQGLGSLRGAIGTPAQIEELIDRYEAAGVDQIIFVSQSGHTEHEHICESIELFSKTVLPKYAERAEKREAKKQERLEEACEQALSRRAPARVADPSYTIRPEGEQTPASVIALAHRAAKNGAGNGKHDWEQRMRKAGEALFSALVRGGSDRQLERIVGSAPALKVIFKTMERSFVPEKSRNFSGDIQYELKSGNRTRRWVISVENGVARAHEGRASDPALTLKTTVPLFARIAAGEIHPAKPFMEGTVEVEGNLELAARLPEMFGQEQLI